MNKKDLQKAFAERSPLSPRQPIEPVEFYSGEAEKAVETEINKLPDSTFSPKSSSVIQKKETTLNNLTVHPNGVSERFNRTVRKPSVLAEMAQGLEEDKRPTERYSFEIFSDQKKQIDELQYQYKRKTGKRLSSSRILREALEEYLDKALKALK